VLVPDALAIDGLVDPEERETGQGSSPGHLARPLLRIAHRTKGPRHNPHLDTPPSFKLGGVLTRPHPKLGCYRWGDGGSQRPNSTPAEGSIRPC